MAYIIKMPKLGMGMNEGIVLEWFIAVGDSVSEGDPTMEIESEKTTAEITASEDGILRTQYVNEDESVAPGTKLGIIAGPDQDISDLDADTDTEDEMEVSPEATATPDNGTTSRERVRASPKARRVASDLGVEIADIAGSGPEGAVTVEDVQEAIESATPSESTVSKADNQDSTQIRATPKAKRLARERNIQLTEIEGTGPKDAVTAADLDTEGQDHVDKTTAVESAYVPQSGETERQSLSPMRQTIADRLGESYREAVHVTVHREIPISEALAAADVVKNYVKSDASISDVLLVVLSVTLAEHPDFNAAFEDGDHILHGSQHIGLAVNLDAGLVTPVLRDVDSRSLSGLVTGRREVTQQALDGEYTAKDLEGGTFTVSNLGVLGIDSFTPIINPPQVAILGVNRIRDRPIQKAGDVAFTPHIGMDLTFDHRIVDGADAAKFLETLANHLMNPWPMLLARS